jgi:hypothetical protein
MSYFELEETTNSLPELSSKSVIVFLNLSQILYPFGILGNLIRSKSL